MADWKNTPQNRALGILAEVLGGVKAIGNKARVPESFPLVGGLGAGDALLGDAPEEVEKWSYGNSPLKEKVPGVSPKYPDFKRGRAQGVADVALLPVMEAYAGAKAAGAAGRAVSKAATSGLRAATEGGFDESRRAAMRKIGGGLATAAQATGAGLGLKAVAEHLAKNAGDVAPAAVKAAVRATPSEFLATMNKARSALMKELRNVDSAHSGKMKRLRAEDWDDYIAALRENSGVNGRDVGVGDYVERQEAYATDVIEPEKQKIRKAHDEELERIRADPQFAGYKTSDEIAKEESALADTADEIREARARLSARLEDELGILPDEKVLALLEKGQKYTDPEYELDAFLDKYGQLAWRNPRTGLANHNKIWASDDRPAP